MATLNLGNIKFNWKGAYAGGTAYVVDDVVSYSGSSYICKLASTGNLPTNGTYWDQMSAAGTDGTDLTTTLTTQGDVLYRDGSGLQRLAAGTSGQVLTTGGAGANISWATVSSDCVKIASADAAGAADIYMDNVFSDTYRYYKLVYGGLKFSSHTNGAWLRFGFRQGSSNFSATYNVKHLEFGGNEGTNTNYLGGRQDDTVGFQIQNTWNLQTDGSPSATSSDTTYAPYKGSGTLQFYHPNSLTNYKPGIIYDTQWNDSGHIGRSIGIGYCSTKQESTSTPIDGIRINCEGHNIAQGFFDLYGFKT